MGRDTLQQVRPGQPVRYRAGQENTIIDAVARFLRGELGQSNFIPGLSVKYFRIVTAIPVAEPETVDDPLVAIWGYTGDEVVPVKYNPTDEPWKDRYANKAGGLTGVILFNDAEERDPNYSENTFGVDSGVGYGNGIKVDALAEGFKISPIPVGRVVRAYYTLVAGGAEWRFCEPNGITGYCPSGEGSGA